MRITRPTLSKKNKFWISKERYYELKHFCLQYPEWLQTRRLIYDANPSMCFGMSKLNSKDTPNPTAELAEMAAKLTIKIDMVEKAAKLADADIFEWLLEAVTQNLSCCCLIARGMPCGRDKFYYAYRKFFWLLSRERD